MTLSKSSTPCTSKYDSLSVPAIENLINSNCVNIDVQEFKQGVYIVSLSKNGISLKTKRLIVEH